VVTKRGSKKHSLFETELQTYISQTITPPPRRYDGLPTKLIYPCISSLGVKRDKHGLGVDEGKLKKEAVIEEVIQAMKHMSSGGGAPHTPNSARSSSGKPMKVQIE